MLLLLLACSSPRESETPGPPPSPTPAVAEESPPPGRIGGEPILERPVIVGGIANEAVEEVVRAHEPALLACRSSQRPGKLLLHFTLSRSGQVQELELRSTTLRHEPTEQCILNEIRGLQFPELERGEIAVVTWPLELP